MPSEREIWTRRKIFCNIESRMWTCLPYGRACEEGAARIFWQRGYWLSFLPSAFYSTPNRQHEKQKLCKVVVSCLPAVSSFQSSRYAKLLPGSSIIFVVWKTTFPPKEHCQSVIRRSRRTEGKACPQQGRFFNYVSMDFLIHTEIV
jgi:hypothetical protein